MKIFNLVITTETVENKRRQLLYKKWANIRMESCKKCRAIEHMGNRAAVRPVIHSLKETGVSLYIKNNDDYTGDASEYKEKYGRVCTLFYSNSEFMSAGRQYINKTKNKECVLFGKDRLKRIK